MIAAIRAVDRTRPLTLAFAIVACFVLYFLSPIVLGTAGQNGPDGMDSQDAANLVWTELGLVGAILIVTVILGDWRGLHFTTPLRWRRLWVLIPILFYLGLFWASAYGGYAQLDDGALALLLPLLRGVLITTALVGIFEELLFRGVFFRGAAASLGPVAAFFLSSVVFGAMHYVNLVSGQSFGNTTIQVLHAAGGGLLYCGLMLYLNSIWPAVILHAVWDCTVFVTQALSSAAMPTDIADAARSGEAVGLFQYAVMGFEPIFGLILFWLWLRRRGSASAQ